MMWFATRSVHKEFVGGIVSKRLLTIVLALGFLFFGSAKPELRTSEAIRFNRRTILLDGNCVGIGDILAISLG